MTHQQSVWLLRTEIQLILTQASQYHRRVVSVLSQFPFQLLKLTQSEPHKACEERRVVAQRLMATHESNLDATTLKFRQQFAHECLHAAQTGCSTDRLEIALGGFRYLMRCHVRESERVNKQIKLILERAPSATTDLISSRVALKYYLGQANAGEGRTRAKWSLYKPVAQKLQNDCLAGWDAKNQISSVVDRFAPPAYSEETGPKSSASPPNPDAHTDDCDSRHAKDDFWSLSNEQINREYVKVKPSLQTTGCKHAWAVCYNMQLGKKIQELWSETDKSEVSSSSTGTLPIPVICFGTRQPTENRSSFTAHMAVEKVRTSYRMVSCHFDTAKNKLRVLLPLKFKSSTDLIASHFESVKNGSTVAVFGVRLTSLGDLDARSMLHGNASGVVRLLQLKAASKAMEQQLDGLSTHGAPSKVGISVAAASVPSSSSLPSSSTSAAPATTPSTAATATATAAAISSVAGNSDGVDSGDADLEEGLKLLLKQEMNRQHRAAASASASSQGGNTCNNDKQDSNLQDASKVLEHALSDFHHLPDDLELEEDEIVNEICGETGEELVSNMESALIKKVLKSGQTPSEKHIDDNIQDGLDIDDAAAEAFLNTEAGLGNFENNSIDEPVQSDAEDEPTVSNLGGSDPPSLSVNRVWDFSVMGSCFETMCH